jgi:hypothetical protein
VVQLIIQSRQVIHPRVEGSEAESRVVGTAGFRRMTLYGACELGLDGGSEPISDYCSHNSIAPFLSTSGV